MGKIEDVTNTVLRALNAKTRTSNDRLVVQKKVYLLQSLGTNLNYFFGWYEHGPFSSALDDFLVTEFSFGGSGNGLQLNDSARANVEKVNSLADKNDTPYGNTRWYEMLASILFIFQNPKSWQVRTDEDVFMAIKRHKSRVDRSVFDFALKTLREEGFC